MTIGDLLNPIALVGNPRAASRTTALAVTLLKAVLADLGVDEPGEVVDLGALLAEVGAPLGADSALRYPAPLAALRSARLAVVATPTYKGSYTGLLKSFLDHVGAAELSRTVAIPVITVGSPAHTLAADVHLRPLLLELGAITPTQSLVVQEADLADPTSVITAWSERARPVLRPVTS
jgi:FMN reductase